MSRDNRKDSFIMSLRLEPWLVKALDHFAMKMNINRTRAIRYLIKRGLIQYGVLKKGDKNEKRNND
tara:strand:+ start:517 stop:714 length:198 start_codon:yes stop_codon:yes gene_type:complete